MIANIKYCYKFNVTESQCNQYPTQLYWYKLDKYIIFIFIILINIINKLLLMFIINMNNKCLY